VCGILGLLLHDPSVDAAQEINEGLSLLQHRGQDACGIVTCGPKGRFYQCKANGMVRDVFDKNAVSRLIGGMGIGHGTRAKVFHWCKMFTRGIRQCGIRLLEARTTQRRNHST
jgi:glutamine phosphoribosylpyrophosphate amidotransferase